MNFEKMPLAKFRLAPTHEVRENEIVQVMVHKRVAFYAISKEYMDYLKDCEKQFHDMNADNLNKELNQ